MIQVASTLMFLVNTQTSTNLKGLNLRMLFLLFTHKVNMIFVLKCSNETDRRQIKYEQIVMN